MGNNIFRNIQHVFSTKNYNIYFLVFSISFFILFGYLLGLEKFILIQPDQILNNIVWELFLPNFLFIILSAALNGLLLTMTIYRLKELKMTLNSKENKASAFSFGFASIFAACPFCAISIASVFGVSFVANFIAPFYQEFQLLSLLITLTATYWTVSKIGEECQTCKIDY